MSKEDRQELPPANVDSNSENASQNCNIPSSDSLEDGEILEGRFSSISSQSLSQQPNGQPEPPRSSDQVSASTPAFPSVEFQAAGPTSSDEPMTKEDLDRAKSLVLDLLGWGVTPEYLVECGLSPAAIYTIFTDLRLRLPNNLVTLSLLPSHHGAP